MFALNFGVAIDTAKIKSSPKPDATANSAPTEAEAAKSEAPEAKPPEATSDAAPEAKD